MSLTISLYSKNAFCEYLLPAVNNTDYLINIRKDDLCLTEDLLLILEVIDNKWKLRSSPSYYLTEGDRTYSACELHDDQIIRIGTEDGSIIAIVTEESQAFHDFEKFDFSGNADISVGRDSSCDISYDFMGLVSRDHARLYRKDGEATVENHSNNGIYVNGERVIESRTLRYGDYINIIGLHMVFLGEQLAVDTRRRNIRISTGLRYADSAAESTGIVRMRPAAPTGKTIYHRPPRRSGSYPGPSELLDGGEALRTLWSRNRSHEDLLVYRVGKDDSGAPATVDLGRNRLVGIAGSADRPADIARAISLQIAASCCYTDVKLVYIYDDDTSRDHGQWAFARWLPHVWSQDHSVRYIADDRKEASEVFKELSGIFRDRLANGNAAETAYPHYVIFISDPSLLEGDPLGRYVTGKYPACGLTAVLLADSYEKLPNNCDHILQCTEEFSGGYGAYGSSEAVRSIDFDTADSRQLERFARHISSFRVSEETGGGELPDSVTFFEMLGIRKPEDLPVKELWAKNRTYESICGQIGVKTGGMPCLLDVHEKYHGPHGLVAGTTGSGKSEALQTYILSLAVNYSPDDVSFLMIDYKGGGMAKLFEGLPHLAGQISNLSGTQVRRAMISIRSEIRRRQRVFNEHGVNNINNYTRLFKSGAMDTPLPHLFIIVDEFAELKMEQPEFMRELISVAQLGRSLGIHLILSTQKPGGIVDDNIWSNSRFRICFRVLDPQDSSDVLHKPDAASLTEIGRGYLQVGNDEVYEQFQAGYSGALFDGDSGTEPSDFIRMITASGRTAMTGGRAKTRQSCRTELDAVIDHLAGIAAQCRYKHANRLWLPELRSDLCLGDLDDFNEKSFSARGVWDAPKPDRSMRFVLGLLDDPAGQTQDTLAPDLMESGNIAVCGSAASGKSTMMQTIAYSLIDRYSPDDVNLYIFDFSSRMMSAFAKAPHTGGVMFEDDQDKIGKSFSLIATVLSERKSILRGGSYRQYMMTHHIRMPVIVIMIDNYAAFREKTGDQYETALMQLAREGIGNGIFLIVAGGGFGLNDIPGRLADSLKTVFTLSLRDRYAYAEALRTMRVDILPEQGVGGRGLTLQGGRALEYQTALALRSDNDYDRMEKLTEVCGRMAETWQGRRARPVPEIPERPDWKSFSSLEEYEAMRDEGSKLPVGYNCDDASVCGIPLEELFCYGVYGARQSGKTNFMKICALTAMDRGDRVCVIDDAKGSLGYFSGIEEVVYCRTDEDIFALFEKLLPEIRERVAFRDRMLAEGHEDEGLATRIRNATQPVFIFISDLAWFIQTLYDSDIEMHGFAESIFEKGSGLNIYFVAELSPDKRSSVAGLPAFDHFIGYRTGIRFGGRAIDDPILIFDHLGYADKTAVTKPGTGMPSGHRDTGGPWKIAVPLAGTLHIKRK